MYVIKSRADRKYIIRSKSGGFLPVTTVFDRMCMNLSWEVWELYDMIALLCNISKIIFEFLCLHFVLQKLSLVFSSSLFAGGNGYRKFFFKCTLSRF